MLFGGFGDALVALAAGTSDTTAARHDECGASTPEPAWAGSDQVVAEELPEGVLHVGLARSRREEHPGGEGAAALGEGLARARDEPVLALLHGEEVPGVLRELLVAGGDERVPRAREGLGLQA
ncbi:hypothetical protein BE17_15715 [Sorangium cellulosum]|uniref:Uncharacterized protein n=1 Tax=Sorangium cellulosum TaxID=56 RepID=A0A150SDD2_SORCE|nr:hypothetical protein BE17_15715 [Sorangium cellulosum]